jgi:hypothetical protein
LADAGGFSKPATNGSAVCEKELVAANPMTMTAASHFHNRKVFINERMLRVGIWIGP